MNAYIDYEYHINDDIGYDCNDKLYIYVINDDIGNDCNDTFKKIFVIN